jgi:hypothetical protein
LQPGGAIGSIEAALVNEIARASTKMILTNEDIFQKKKSWNRGFILDDFNNIIIDCNHI